MGPEPVQLPLFPDCVALIRIRPDRHEWRFYRMEVWPDLFGRALLMRQWGRIGTKGRRRLDPHPDAGAAINALATLARQERRRGYQGSQAVTARAKHKGRKGALPPNPRQGAARPGPGIPSRSAAAAAARAADDTSMTVIPSNGDKAMRKSVDSGAKSGSFQGLPTQHKKRRVASSPKAPSPAPPTAPAGMQLHTANGARKYLTAGERDAFLREAERADRAVRTLCMTLAYAGCRLSEALALTADRVDLAAGVLVIESLKKRRTGIYRAVPVPPSLLEALDLVHGIPERQTRRGQGRDERLWPWSRMTGWRAVHAVMASAGLDGPHASPKGLRHGFGVAAVSAGIPLNLVQKWLGHAQLTTTAIYANAIGAEEQDIARRMWG